MDGEHGTSPSMLCPDLVDRTRELTALRDRLASASDGHGGVLVLRGEPGTGKTRLLREAVALAHDLGVRVLAGRSVPDRGSVPYRPLTEAFLAAFRSVPRPTSPELAGFGAHLGRLVPAWSAAEAGVDDSPLMMGEAVVRLLRPMGPCLLVLEDLHWADAETVAVLDHLADALTGESTLVLGTTRVEGALTEVLERLVRRDPSSVLPVAPLEDGGVDRMVTSCLATPAPPPEVGAFLRARSEGIPLVVEELLAGLVTAGELRLEQGRWSSPGELTARVPASLRESVARRLAALDPVTRRVVGAAAVLGRRFDWELVPGIADVDGRAAADALRTLVDRQLVEVDGHGFAFRHALTREAVLDDLLPPDRRELARRARPVVERANPGLPGSSCELVAELAEAAGDPVAAASYLVESARRALADGAVASAEITVRRARRLAGDDEAVRRDVDEVAVDVLVAAGKPREALEIGRGVASRMGDTGVAPERRVALLLTLARAAVGAGDVPGAVGDLAAARAAADGHVDDALAARITAVDAHVALEQGRADDAETLARGAVDAAVATGQPAVECEGLEVLGRIARDLGPGASTGWLERAARVAERAGLATWHLRARHELALRTWEPEALRATRDLAARYGALTTVAVMELSLADLALGDFDRAESLRAAQACVDASTRYGLATAPVAHLWLAGAHALAGDDTAMQVALDRALAPDPADPRVLGDLYGRVLATRSFVADDLGALRDQLDTMIGHVRAADPGRSVFPGRVLWAMVHTAEDDDLGVAARAENADATEHIDMAVFRCTADMIEAVADGRAGAGADAASLMERARATDLSAGVLGLRHGVQLLAARAAIRDGWGDPVAWLRETEAFFATRGHERTARRCRLLIGEAGAPVPRRGRGTSVVPAALRALGVTSREVDVLELVALGLSNREIGARLFLSPRTVERHLGSLFARTGLHDRGALGALARSHGVQDG